MSHKKILKIEEQEKLLEKELEIIKKKLDKLQEEKMLFQKSCPHVNRELHGWEHGSDRNIFKCDDCHFIGYYTDFSK